MSVSRVVEAGLADPSLPRANGALVFDAPWQGRALAMAVLTVERTGRTWDDFRRHLTELVPHEGVYYAHDDFDLRTQNLHPDERKNGHAHVKAMLLSATSHAIPVVAGEPALGTWQRLIFFEMDEPKERTVSFHVFGA